MYIQAVPHADARGVGGGVTATGVLVLLRPQKGDFYCKPLAALHVAALLIAPQTIKFANCHTRIPSNDAFRKFRMRTPGFWLQRPCSQCSSMMARHALYLAGLLLITRAEGQTTKDGGTTTASPPPPAATCTSICPHAQSTRVRELAQCAEHEKTPIGRAPSGCSCAVCGGSSDALACGVRARDMKFQRQYGCSGAKRSQ